MPRFFIAGSGEKMQYIVHEHNDNTIRFVLRYPGIVRQETMRLAARALADSVDVLHASFRPGRLGALWRVNSDYADEDVFQAAEVTGDVLAPALALALKPVPHDHRTQFRCALVRNERESALVMTISHLCVDGGDGKYLLRKLAEAYSMMAREGSCAGLQVKNGNRAAEQVYENLDLRERRALLKDPRTGVRSVFPFPTEEEGTPRVLRRTISAEVMGAARLRAKALGATVNDVLLAACYHAYAAVPGVDPRAPMSVASMMDLRRHCRNHDSQGLSNMSGPLSTWLPEGVADAFEDTLTGIAAQTRRIKEDPLAGLHGMPLLHGAARTLPIGLLLAAAGRLYSSLSVGLTNLGAIDGDALRLDGLAPVEGWFGGPLKKKPAMQVSAASFDGACSLAVVGCFTEEDAALLTQLLDDMAGCIMEFAADRCDG